MRDFWTMLARVRAEGDVLAHPFYVRWTNGDLRREELAVYAGQYRHAVVAIADAATYAADLAGPDAAGLLRRHAAEERSHVALWDRFAEEVGAPGVAGPAPETADCVASWADPDGDLLDQLVVLYVIEAAQPAISEAKRAGLGRHYGVDSVDATSYFDLHAELDRDHAAEGRELISARLTEERSDGLLARAGAALAGNWTLLDGVERLAAA
jgi:pyrroloquinoline-quinone synthase